MDIEGGNVKKKYNIFLCKKKTEAGEQKRERRRGEENLERKR